MPLSSTGSAIAARRGLRLTPISFDARTALVAVAVIVATVAISAASAGRLLLALLVLGAVLVCVWMFISERYQLTLAVLMLYLALLDGYLKLKLNTSWATLGRDALLYAIVIGALVRAAVRRQPIRLPPMTGWVLAFCAVVLMQVFNPAAGSWGHAVASVRPHLEFVPLFFLGYWTMRSPKRLRAFLALLLLVAAINGVVSFVQFSMTPDEFAGWGQGYSDRIYGTATVSARLFKDSSGVLHPRPFGLGGDSGFGGVLGMLAVPAALALLLARGRTRPLPLALILVLAAGAAAAVITSQARAAIISSVLAALAFGVLASVSRRLIGTLAALLVTAIVALVTVALVTGSSHSAFREYRTITPNRVFATTYEYRRGTLALIPEYVTDFPLGAGIGSAGPAVGYGGGLTRGRGLNAESEPNYLLLELGIPGLLVLLGFNLKLLALALRRTHRLPDVELRLLLAALLAPLFAIFGGWIIGITTSSTPTSPYFWFVAGIAAYWLAGRGERIAPLVPKGAAPVAPPAPPLAIPRTRPVAPPTPPLAIARTRPAAPSVPMPSVAASTAMRISVVYRDQGAPVDGIRDYSRGLTAALADRGANVSLHLTHGRELPPNAVRADAVILQYNPFAYGRRGFAPWLPRAVERLSRARPRPIIAVMVHEPFFPLHGWRGTLMGGWQRMQLAALRSPADVTFVSIEPWLGTVRNWGPRGSLHHVPIGSNLPDMRSHRPEARAELGVGEDTIVLAAFGTAHPSRLMGHIASSAVALHEAGYSVVVLNLGAGAPALEEVAESVRIESPGRLEARELARRLSAADLFVAPFVDGVSSRRTTFAAALQHALPVVATDGASTDRFIRDARGACRLVPVQAGPAAFAEAVLELAREAPDRERLAQNARLLYEQKFAWPVIADLLLEHLRDAVPVDARGASSDRRRWP